VVAAKGKAPRTFEDAKPQIDKRGESVEEMAISC
jgi:hypothetical protein